MDTNEIVTVLHKSTIKAGDDYRTVEVALALKPGAADDDIAAALETASRMSAALEDFVAARIAALRAATPPPTKPTIKDPNAPATGEYAEDADGNTTACKGGQFGYLAKLVMDFGYEFSQVGVVIRTAGHDPATLTKGAASALIEAWLEQPGDEPGQPPVEGSPEEPPAEEQAEAERAAVADLIHQIQEAASRFSGGFEKVLAKIEGKLSKPLEQATAAELQPYLDLLQKGNGKPNGQ